MSSAELPRISAPVEPEADVADEVLGDAVDGERVAAEQLRRDRLVDIGLDRLRHEEGLAEPDEALVGVDAQPEEVGELLEPDGFDGGDLHFFLPGRAIAPRCCALLS